ncbi:uncharacterized protein LOC105436629 [Strongylocentrotus purpuratus]|uniref:Uncharacterized protein n=1 Tax=Strongylocentrotus purpuratus TaxID=7668 RepID=A0A7M7NDN3_STRPU|nr:uncharacterized protein LOC105436629 [Strongylocentrotus purpuratus]
MDNYATVANCYEDSKPADSSPGEPYYLTVEADSTPGEPCCLTLEADIDQNDGFGIFVIKDSNGWNETDTGVGFVDNVLYGTSDEQIPKLGNPTSGAPETDEDGYEGYEDKEIVVDNELYNAPSRTTPGYKLETLDDKGNDVYENPDENVYTEFTDDEILIDNELYGAPSPIAPRVHKLGAVVDEGKDPVYENPDGNVYETYVEEDAMIDNELYGAATPPTSRADNTNDPVVGDGGGEMYQNTEFHSVPTNLIANELYKSVDEI